MAATIKIGFYLLPIVRGGKDGVKSVLVLDKETALTQRVFHRGKPALRYQIPVARHVAEKIPRGIFLVEFTF
jgi:hypothetical protein